MSTLATVNGVGCEVTAALRSDIAQGNALLNSVVSTLLIRQHAAQHGIRNSDEELQLAFDELRYSRRLESLDAVHQWMLTNHQTLGSMQEEVDNLLLRNKVENAISESQIEVYYTEHEMEFQSVALYSIRLHTEEKAQELAAQIREDGENFHLMAMQHSVDDHSRLRGGFVGNLKRSEMIPAVETEVFKPKPGSVIGPVKTDYGWNLFLATAINKPSLDDAKEGIRAALMEELLGRLRSEAGISFPVFEQVAGA